MAILGSSWDEDSDDYDGPMFGSGFSDHMEEKQIAKRISEDLGIELSEVKQHMIQDWKEKFKE